MPTLEERVSDLEKKLTEGFKLKSENGHFAVSVICTDSVAGIWCEDLKHKTRVQLCNVHNQVYAGATVDKPGSHGDAAALAVENGCGAVQLRDEQGKFYTLTANDVKYLQELRKDQA